MHVLTNLHLSNNDKLYGGRGVPISVGLLCVAVYKMFTVEYQFRL